MVSSQVSPGLHVTVGKLLVERRLSEVQPIFASAVLGLPAARYPVQNPLR
jgi:hypothetical protein